MAEPVFEIFKDKKDRYRFRLRAKNQEIIAASQGYSNKQACRKGIDSIKNNASKADVVEKGKDEIKIWRKGDIEVDSTTEGVVGFDSTTVILVFSSFVLLILAILLATF